MRLNRFLAQAGIASRRQADQFIKEGRVSLNGMIITEMGTQVNPDTDDVKMNENRVILKPEFEYLVLNKPPGFLSTVRDPFNRPTVMDLLPKNKIRLYPVGRLDLDTSGLLFFTNDGDLALALTHPRHFVEKVYLAKVNETPTEDQIHNLEQGILLDDGLTIPAKVELETIENGNAIIKIILREGRKRQIKRMMQAIGHPVIQLQRIAIGPLTLGGLKPGEFRQPTALELEELLKLKRKIISED